MTDTANAAANHPAPELRIELRHCAKPGKPVCKICFLRFRENPVPSNSPTNPCPRDSDLWYTVVAGGAIRGEMTCVCGCLRRQPRRKFLGETDAAETATEAPSAESISAESKEALEELLRQVAGLAATALAPSAGGEVQLHLSASAAPSWSRTPSSASKPRTQPQPARRPP